MATALIGGLVSKGADGRDFRVVEPLPAQHEKLVGRFAGIGVFGEPTADPIIRYSPETIATVESGTGSGAIPTIASVPAFLIERSAAS